MDEVLRQVITENECLVATGLDHAIMGVTAGPNVRVVYSCAALIQRWMLDGWESEEAIEHLHYNVIGSVPGLDNAPIFLDDL